MIQQYFRKIEALLAEYPDITSIRLETKTYNSKQGCIIGTIIFANDSRLEFMEVKNTDIDAKIKYRYHYMNRDLELVFRYDNAPHQKDIPTFPNHKHEQNGVTAAPEPSMQIVLQEIAFLVH